jgi:hypothetical protein
MRSVVHEKEHVSCFHLTLPFAFNSLARVRHRIASFGSYPDLRVVACARARQALVHSNPTSRAVLIPRMCVVPLRQGYAGLYSSLHFPYARPALVAVRHLIHPSSPLRSIAATTTLCILRRFLCHLYLPLRAPHLLAHLIRTRLSRASVACGDPRPSEAKIGFDTPMSLSRVANVKASRNVCACAVVLHLAPLHPSNTSRDVPCLCLYYQCAEATRHAPSLVLSLRHRLIPHSPPSSPYLISSHHTAPSPTYASYVCVAVSDITISLKNR